MEILILDKEDFLKEHKKLKKQCKRFKVSKFTSLHGSIIEYFNKNNEIDLKIITGRVKL